MLTPVRTTVINKTSQKALAVVQRRDNVGRYTGAATENRIEAPKTQNRLPNDPATPCLAMYPNHSD